MSLHSILECWHLAPILQPKFATTCQLYFAITCLAVSRPMLVNTQSGNISG
ncbi:hypothetical protein SLEP1_g31002 [Rubroshorea leprosula]|uniref:Uncharacterized protein n=1 Tax=Rubroshorea leprosula TaxID=152421 RepID=A0AAV5K9R8_9ROSI|nr:hypothetical protein SLEP1_g31002 [Rubroshorea leprosula]